MAATATANWTRGASRILIASCDAKVRERVLCDPEFMGMECLQASGGAQALARLRERRCDGVFLDRNLGDLDAVEVAELIRHEYPNTTVNWIEEGMADRQSTAPMGEAPKKEAGNVVAWERQYGMECVESLPGMIGRSPAMQEVYRLVRLVARHDTTVLITGDTGTGKELVAEAIHALSLRANQPFVVVNCAAIPETLLEAELFGHARGAFTGAVQSRLGRIHVAQGGTLFLDEIGELPLAMQAKLLRFLQSGEVQRLGSSDVHRVDVRVVCATNVQLHELIAAKQFRMDLYYRLSVFPVELPALCDRVEDVEALGKHFLLQLGEEGKDGWKHLTQRAIESLKRRSWPGNVRELQHAIERASILSGEQDWLEPAHFSGRGLHVDATNCPS
jgi:transcriptional regulator with GAF, ATPase, and Fis domain